MRILSPTFQPHIQLAHTYWQDYLQSGDSAIDATCGNGYDTLLLSQLALRGENGHVYAFDIQEQALAITQKRLEAHLTATQLRRVQLIKGCHSNFMGIPQENTNPIRLIVYNLGYLPGGDKTYTTVEKTTLLSMQKACELLAPEGLISITCYPGHPAGAAEESALIELASTLPRQHWSCCHHRWINRQRAPSLLLLQKM